MNSWARYQESKMEWGDRSAGGDWLLQRVITIRLMRSIPVASHRREWAARPHYSNLTYRPNDPKGDGKGKKSGKDDDTAREPTDPATEHAATDPGGSAILPAEAIEDPEVDEEIEAALRASIQQRSYLERVNTILETDSPVTVFNKAFADFGNMDQAEIDATLNALQYKVSTETLAGVIHVVDAQVVAPQVENTEDTGSSRRDIQVPAQKQQHIPKSPHSVEREATAYTGQHQQDGLESFGSGQHTRTAA
eukprot:6473576-Amphidinium_carterae.1